MAATTPHSTLSLKSATEGISPGRSFASLRMKKLALCMQMQKAPAASWGRSRGESFRCGAEQRRARALKAPAQVAHKAAWVARGAARAELEALPVACVNKQAPRAEQAEAGGDVGVVVGAARALA